MITRLARPAAPAVTCRQRHLCTARRTTCWTLRPPRFGGMATKTTCCSKSTFGPRATLTQTLTLTLALPLALTLTLTLTYGILYNQVRALRHRTPYNMTLSRAYKAGKNELPHHVDALGNWVVLFSFGLTVDFYVGHKTLCIESGDALIFNGGAAHGVVHGFTRAVRSHSTYRGKERALVGMAAIDNFRLSVQARQS